MPACLDWRAVTCDDSMGVSCLGYTNSRTTRPRAVEPRIVIKPQDAYLAKCFRQTIRLIAIPFLKIANTFFRNVGFFFHKRLELLKTEHRDLDAAIEALMASGSTDQLQIARLKKRKLALRDQISLIEDNLLPDIIA